MNVMNGNSAVAMAVKQVNPDVVVAHPVAPAAPMIEKISSFVSNGRLDTEIVNVESWSSAISGLIGASASGGRVFTAAASQGLAQMHEMLFIASSLRLPIVVGVADRALSAPLNTHADHSDTMSERDCGWIQFFSEDPQEAYDNIIQAFKVAEHPDVRTPIMVAMDGWITSHTDGDIIIEDDREIDEFVGKFEPHYSLMDTENPVTIGSHAGADYYFEHKIDQLQGIENARKIIKEVGKEFGDRFGRYYGYFESYKLDDADYAIVLMSSSAGIAKEAVDRLRTRGEKVGLLKLRVFRPFPSRELRETLQSLKSIAALERDFSPGAQGGPLFNEIRSALYNNNAQPMPMIFPYIYGLGGRDIETEDIETIFREIKEKSEKVESDIEMKFINLKYRQAV